MPIILTGPKESADYFRAIDDFIKATLGEPATKLYRIIVGDAPEVARVMKEAMPKIREYRKSVGDAPEVARVMKEAMPKIREYRKSVGDAYSFNWSLKIEPEFQVPFEPDHASMASLDLHRNQPPQLLAANLRRAFSGIVAGNVKEGGIRAIEKKGPFKLHGDKELMHLMDKLLESFVKQQRMKLPGSQYVPCYEIVR
ncbi:MAG: pyrimidine/purine nucleotide monophosphate nucleosidase domain-containing protein, partial [Aeromonas veronii]